MDEEDPIAADDAPTGALAGATEDGVPVVANANLLFMQASELDDPASFENGAVLVEKDDIAAHRDGESAPEAASASLDGTDETHTSELVIPEVCRSTVRVSNRSDH